MLTNFEFVHFSILCIPSLASKYSSLFVNREKSRDLQRGQTDSGQLPLMMNFNCVPLIILSALTFLSSLCFADKQSNGAKEEE